MTTNIKSYGYFFNGIDPENGKYVVLPAGHNADDRLKAQEDAGIDYEFCALFYSSNGVDFVPFSNDPSDETTLVLDKKSNFGFTYNYTDHEIVSDLELTTAFFNNSEELSRLKAQYDFTRSKAWLTTNVKDENVN